MLHNVVCISMEIINASLSHVMTLKDAAGPIASRSKQPQAWYGRQSFWGGGSDWGFRVGYGHRTGGAYRTGAGFDLPTGYNSRDWDVALGQFVKVMPTDYKRVLEERRERELAAA